MNYNNPNLIFNDIPSGKTGWSSPSNIAIVKYWGKKGVQIPSNPSLSFTLSNSLTETIIEFSPAEKLESGLDFYLDGIPNTGFAAKISTFFSRIIDIFPFIGQLNFRIYSKNTFPHSTGIASSASGMSAIALCLCDIENQYFNTFSNEQEFYNKASFVARLGSGSACRSVYGPMASWGKSQDLTNSSDLFASELPFTTNQIFNDYRDTILIIDSGQKKVSSTVGHGLMDNNPFSNSRIQQANHNYNRLLQVLQSGDLDEFINITESEALTLHAMMMTSNPSFLLMKPLTIEAIDRIREFRKETKVPVCFTLDAGPNIHLLYPHQNRDEVAWVLRHQHKRRSECHGGRPRRKLVQQVQGRHPRCGDA